MDAHDWPLNMLYVFRQCRETFYSSTKKNFHERVMCQKAIYPLLHRQKGVY